MKRLIAVCVFLGAAVSGVYAESLEMACARYCNHVVGLQTGTPQFVECVNQCSGNGNY